MDATISADVNRMLDLLLARISQTLGKKLIGLYLYGSLVTGDFDEVVSDIDLLAVTTNSLATSELDSLKAMHAAIGTENPTWDNRVEVAYVSQDALRTARTHRSTIAATSPGEPFHTKEAGSDWLINWYVVRTYGKTLYGPPPETFIDPVTQEELIQTVHLLAGLWREATYEETWSRNAQVYATLTLCRAFYTVKEGGFVSKKQAALWATQELPMWSSLIQAALTSWREDWYNDHIESGATLPETRRFVRDVVDRIAASAITSP
jgi:hypothetical protein